VSAGRGGSLTSAAVGGTSQATRATGLRQCGQAGPAVNLDGGFGGRCVQSRDAGRRGWRTRDVCRWVLRPRRRRRGLLDLGGQYAELYTLQACQYEL